MLKPGDPAPDFHVSDHTGREVRLADFRGKTVVLWFYPKASTPGCTAEGCSFRDLAADYAGKNAAILGVSFDDAAANRRFAEAHHFTFPLLCDTDRAMGLAYGACSDAQAKSAQRIGVVIGADGRVREVHPKVDAKSWPATLLASLG